MGLMCRVFTILLFVLALLPARAGAQSVMEPNGVTLTPFLSFTFGASTDPEIDFSSSLGLGAALGYDWTSNIGVEFEFGRVFDLMGELNAADLSLTSISGNFVYHFDVLRVTPYATAGLGWQHSNIDFDNEDLDDEGESEIAFNFGGGIKIPLNDRLLARADLRRFLVNDLGPDHWRLYGGVTFWLKR